ncbi:MAG TPA: tetratricopeptide repeat protein [Chthoniobacterales bacterium]|nr:tetratricopeptide repeat protein [Chthoniobacterales bacterium]
MSATGAETMEGPVRHNLWILDSWRDLVLYVGTPLLLVPVFAVAQTHWSGQDIYLFVAAMGSMGHHLPGMIRAYGDRALFERFRWRFVFAPIFLLATCIAFYVWNLNVIFLVVFFWGIWHGMMQTYGFCRIYDAKAGSFAARTRRLDFAVCGAWFAAAVLFSPDRMMTTLGLLYVSGVPYIPRWAIVSAQYFILGLTIIATLLFLINLIQSARRGERPNPVKLALLITTIVFWWYCNDLITNILAGIALFEVFHDVQYLSLVWIYNRNRVEKDNSIGGFMRFVFRRSGALIGFYVALVVVYGSFGYAASFLEVGTVKRALMGIVAASGLLHFYYDGFIWKVRERSTRESLGLAGGTANISLGGLMPAWATHAGKWAAAFVLPLASLGLLQTRGIPSEVIREAWLMSDLPNDAREHRNYADILYKAGRETEAAEQYRLAVQLNPKSSSSHNKLGAALLSQSKIEAALSEFDAAVQLEPTNGEYYYDRGYTLFRLGRGDEGAADYITAARLAPKSERVQNGYATLLQHQGKIDEAIAARRQAIRDSPKSLNARLGLGDLLLEKGELDEARKFLLEAIEIDGKNAQARDLLGKVYERTGQPSQAITESSEASRMDPGPTGVQQDRHDAEEQETEISSSNDNHF